MKLRYSEAFYSVQGEGKFVGVPSVFLRTFGCNFRCMNFGLGKDEPSRAEKHEAGQRYNQEVKDLLDDGIIAKTEKFTDLPIIHTGCDTYASIYPEFKHFNKEATIDEVVEHLLSLTPNGKWVQDNGQDVHLILTGGEPLLAWQRLYVELFEHPRMKDLKNVTFETNTTQHLHDDFFHYLNEQDRFAVTWSCSPKLSTSGEAWDDAIKPDVALCYSLVDDSELYFKFVVADSSDIDEAGKAVQAYRARGLEAPVYLMPMGGRSEEYNLNVQEVANICMEKGWRFTPRLHISLFGNAWGT
ncbi:7-carboxy-7-deazaguanine synthase QueE [bacterium]|nr:7-carboxy-7-deazaguanine synthase QueE [bacterium]MDC1257050.1 7-carboxy-7-deazaguanine synthase QueE [bacterium]